MNHVYNYAAGLLLAWLLAAASLRAQTGTLVGKVIDKDTGEELMEAAIQIVGTYKGAYADENGNYRITEIKPGDYSVRVTYVGYAEQVVNGVSIRGGQTTTLNFRLTGQSKTLETVEILGNKNLIDLESGKSTVTLTAEDLKDRSVSDVQSLAAQQVGVSQSPDGIQVRGGRVYETQYYVDGVSAQSRLGGTGFGVDVAKNAIAELSVITGGAGSEYGGATSGVVLTKIKEGGDVYQVSGSYLRDYLGNPDWDLGWNSDQVSLSLGGPLVPRLGRPRDSMQIAPKRRGFIDDLYVFASGDMRMTDTYFRITARELNSSIVDNDRFWAPRQDNRWSGTTKLTWRIRKGMKLSVSTQSSLAINQNTRMLQILGNEDILVPGFQYPFSLNMDNAQTYTQKSNLSIVNFQSILGSRWTMNLTLSRLFTNLRADANGRPFRDAEINQIYDPRSIITYPISVFNPDSSVVLVNPTNGLINNGGIATRWHDHHEQELTIKGNFNYAPQNKIHYFSFGFEHREQEYQWIDVFRPWVGAPIRIDENTIFSTNRIGISSEIWRVNPAEGGVYFEDKIRYKGIIASMGLRFSYWAPGRYADEAVENRANPLPDFIREDYRNSTVPIAGRRWKARLLPNLNVSFPVTENNVLYFNYSHTLRTQHPRFLYSGLDPKYLSASVLSDLGNPNLDPETAVAYEVGLKTQLTSDWALSLTAFYKDQFNFATIENIQVRNQNTGRLENKSFMVSSDYARTRGVEASIQRRIGRWFNGSLTGSYQVATGKSNTAYESKLLVQQTGRRDVNKETFLAWDRPFEFKGYFAFSGTDNSKLFFLPLKGFRLAVYTIWRSGFRYTPVVEVNTTEFGRPIFERDENADRFSKVGSNWFWTDVRLTKSFRFRKRGAVEVFVEVKNLFDNLNAQIINPVTGTAYRLGDPVPNSLRGISGPVQDPRFQHPFNRGTIPLDPSRYLEPRQFQAGLNLQF